MLKQEVQSILVKEAIECIPLLERDFYSRYFIGLYRSSSAKPYSEDAQVQNAYDSTYRDSNQVKRLVCHGTVDLKDVYFYKSILPKHR